MNIELKEITIRDVFNGYKDSAENGVVGYGGKLDIRPAFQREFVYGPKERDAVLDTVIKGFPLNVMYWCDDGSGNYELLDGQQRTISVCQYCNSDFSLGDRYFHNLTETEKNQILDYKLMVYVCTGNDKEKLDWFKTINIAGVELSPQELRNAVYSGPWVSDAKRYFSKTGCAAVKIADKLLNGKMIRQEYLETAIRWIALSEDKSIEAYMAEHQHKNDASELWLYFQTVINWVDTKFTVSRKEMKGLPWGEWYHEFKQGKCAGQIIEKSPVEIETAIKDLIADTEVQTVKGIYEYIVDGEEKHLSLRAFDDVIKYKVYEEQGHKCPYCDKAIGGHTYPDGKTEYDYNEMEGDHIVPWSQGGKTEENNCQMLCKWHNGHKSAN